MRCLSFWVLVGRARVVSGVGLMTTPSFRGCEWNLMVSHHLFVVKAPLVLGLLSGQTPCLFVLNSS